MNICFDTETTGLAEDDEIIQLSIADADTDKQIWNEYYRPSEALMSRGWQEAEQVTGITPEMVADKKTLHDDDVFDKIKSIFNNATTIIGYHVAFDVKMAMRAGFVFNNALFEDPMYAFANWYWNLHPELDHTTKKGKVLKNGWMPWMDNVWGYSGRWCPRNLTFASTELCGNSDFGAHDSMNDVLATNAVWRAMKKKETEILQRGIAKNEDGFDMTDSKGTPIWLNEKNQPAVFPNGRSMMMNDGVSNRGIYVQKYSFPELMTIDAPKK